VCYACRRLRRGPALPQADTRSWTARAGGDASTWAKPASTPPPQGARYDLVLDCVGGLKTSPLKQACRKALAPDGRYISIDDGNLELSSRRLEQLTALIEAGTLTPILGATYPLDSIVDAHRFVEAGHKRGGVAVTIQQP
jgi:NADPH:quinone reductase-like Zn-dependent oxidoreductase